MSESGFSLLDLKGVSEPITKLIESVSKGIGTIYEPTKTVRNAKAEAKAMLILAEAKQEMSEVEGRAYERVKYKELRRQSNIDSIVEGAANCITDPVSPESVDEDWIVNFFELSQDVGNEQLQQVWSKLLAGEITRPGSCSHRTLQVIKGLTTKEANAFVKLCSFSFQTDGKYIFPSLNHDFFEFIRNNGFSTDMETHLKNIGLLSHSPIYREPNDENEEFILARYFSNQYYLKGQEEDNALQFYPLTEIGNELASISEAEINEKYINCLVSTGNVILKT
jgi:hypothetical protein